MILYNIDDGNVVLMDCSKSFDSIDRVGIIHKLQCLYRDTLIWISKFLLGGQCVKKSME